MAITNLKSKQKFKKWLIIGLCIILCVVVIGGVIIRNISSNNSEYLSVTTSKETISTYHSFSGYVASAKTQNIMAGKILQVEKIHVNEGDKVSVGTVLFTTSDNTQIKSLIDGTVNKIMIEVDQQVMSGGQMAEIVDLDNLEIEVKIDEYDIDAIEVDEKIEVKISSIDKYIEGTISEISRTATSKNGVAYFYAIVKLEFDKDIKVGMTAEAKILKEEAKDAVVIPMKAISFDDENNPFVYVSDDNKGIYKVSVIVGITDGKNIEIKSGLHNDQKVYYKDTNSSQSNDSGLMPPGRQNQ